MSQSALIPALAPVLAIVDGVPTTTSVDVARHFGKRHEHVTDAVRGLLAQLPENAHPNFRVSEYTDSTGRKLPAYLLTRDGFTLLAMGFTGKKALAFKLAYIDAFNRMEAALHGPQAVSPERVRLAQSIAAEVSAEAYRTVLEAVMAGGSSWRFSRWIFSLDYDARAKKLNRPLVNAVASDAVVMSLSDLAASLPKTGAMLPSNKELTDLAAACIQRIATRLSGSDIACQTEGSAK